MSDGKPKPERLSERIKRRIDAARDRIDSGPPSRITANVSPRGSVKLTVEESFPDDDGP